MNDFDHLIGRKVNVKAIGRTYRDVEYHDYDIDDPEFLTEMALRYPGTIRYLTPGTIGTLDYDTSRMNIEIDKTGTITNIYFG